ncbi:MAG: thiamine diphosphokinase [Caldilinea sp.]|nr:thiamine diphosphokinase [Caldilinea sp.]MDW8439185.1 thiamine diphosphokinase [Caldilineaceae bacterium]
MRALVAVNGVIQDYSSLQLLLRADDYLVAADGGALHWLALGRTPHVVVGDLDSLPAAVIEELAAQGVHIERHPREKDQTDIELAIERAIRDGADEVLLIGALGGRLDQTLANVLLLAQRNWPASVRLVEGNQIAEVVRGPGAVEFHGAPGDLVSLIPLSPTVQGVTYRGLRYPLENAELFLGSTRAISNEMAETHASISIRQGLALVVHTLNYRREDEGSAEDP